MSAFSTCWQLAAAINGWLTSREARFLFELGRSVPRGGTVVEIGSFFGRSTVCLARGSLAGQCARIVAVDPQIGSPKHTHLLGCEDPFPWLCANLRRAGVGDLVEVRRCTSIEAARDSSGPVDVVFVDGSHEEHDVRADFDHWFPKLRVGGTIAFHDSWHMQGVRAVTTRLLWEGSELADPRLVDTITACTKTERRARHRAFVASRMLLGPVGFLRLTYRGTRLRRVGT